MSSPDVVMADGMRALRADVTGSVFHGADLTPIALAAGIAPGGPGLVARIASISVTTLWTKLRDYAWLIGPAVCLAVCFVLVKAF